MRSRVIGGAACSRRGFPLHFVLGGEDGRDPRRRGARDKEEEARPINNKGA